LIKGGLETRSVLAALIHIIAIIVLVRMVLAQRMEPFWQSIPLPEMF